jgi:hypothetical protein
MESENDRALRLHEQSKEAGLPSANADSVSWPSHVCGYEVCPHRFKVVTISPTTADRLESIGITQDDLPLPRRLVGKEDYVSNGQRERSWWIGKPWRRIELNVFGEGEYREWEVAFTLAWPKMGWHLHGTLVRSWNDYSDEPNQ